jgi:uncharacterized protein YndB with AHSA1/START domain
MKSEVKMEGNRLQVTRVFAAPRPRVFSYWTSGEKLQQWSGCKEATKCEVVMDFRVGGGYTQKMQIAGVGEFTLTATYDEIVEPERIVYRANIGPAVIHICVEFFEDASGTKVVLTHDGLPDAFHCQTVSQGTVESLDKLDAVLIEKGVAA